MTGLGLKSSTRSARSAQVAIRKKVRMEELIAKERFPQALGGVKRDEEYPQPAYTDPKTLSRTWTF